MLPPDFRLLLLLTVFASTLYAAESPPLATAIGNEPEETFELRLEQVLITKGPAALLERIQREVAINPRPYAVAWLAHYRIYGDLLGTPKFHDQAAGYTLARQAMEGGSLMAKELVGRAIIDGRGPDRNTNAAMAVALLREAAEAGRYTAMGELGKLYFFGAGVPKDLALAEVWARRAAYRGYPAMLNYFGHWKEEGTGGHPIDVDKACGYYLEAALRGNATAAKRLGELAKTGNRTAIKCEHLRTLAFVAMGGDITGKKLKRAVATLEQGWPDDPTVLVAVAEVRLERQLIVFDVKLANQMLAKAAALGSSDARYQQAEILRRGIGRKKDPAAALQLLEELAKEGNAAAIGRLGWMHYWGADESKAIQRDPAKAFQLVRDAAHLGDRWSVMNVAFAHEHGIGTSVNYYLAARYYSIAEDLGFVEARRRRASALAAVKD